MKITDINIFRTVIDKFNGQGPTIDDIILSQQADKFYASREAAALEGLIKYIRGKNTAEATAFADELEKRLLADPSAAPVQRPAPAVGPAVATPPQAQAQETDEKSLVSRTVPATAALRQPGEVFLIEPDVEIEIHPLAAAFPRMAGEEFESLKTSIAADGQQTPVVVDGCVLLDGWSRLTACLALGRSVKAVQWDGRGTAEALILALNLRRRHLTAVQRAAVAVKLLPTLEKEAAERRGARTDIRGKVPSGGKSVDLAGAQVHVSGKYVLAAKKISEASAEIYQKLLNGSATLAQAKKEIKAAAAPVSGPDAKQPASKRYSLYEAIIEIIKLVPDESNEKLFDIADEAPPVIKKALVSFFPDEDSPVSAEEDGINQPSIDM